VSRAKLPKGRPRASASLTPNIRSAAGFSFSMTPSASVVTMPSTAASTIARVWSSLARRARSARCRAARAATSRSSRSIAGPRRARRSFTM
jgi:hypothetical protein